MSWRGGKKGTPRRPKSPAGLGPTRPWPRPGSPNTRSLALPVRQPTGPGTRANGSASSCWATPFPTVWRRCVRGRCGVRQESRATQSHPPGQEGGQARTGRAQGRVGEGMRKRRAGRDMRKNQDSHPLPISVCRRCRDQKRLCFRLVINDLRRRFEFFCISELTQHRGCVNVARE
jgi:hypothetical protein